MLGKIESVETDVLAQPGLFDDLGDQTGDIFAVRRILSAREITYGEHIDLQLRVYRLVIGRSVIEQYGTILIGSCA